MAELPHMPISTDALLSDAGDLPNVLFGAYCRLLFRWWRERAMPEPNEKRLARWAGLTTAEFEDLKEFLTLTDAGWTQKRLFETYAKVLAKSEQAKDASASRWASGRNADASKNYAARNANQNHNHNRKRRAGARISNSEESVSCETSAAKHEDPECAPYWEAMRKAIGDVKLGAWFQIDGKPCLRKNCAGFVIEATPMRADRIQQEFGRRLDDIFGKKNWRVDARFNKEE